MEKEVKTVQYTFHFVWIAMLSAASGKQNAETSRLTPALIGFIPQPCSKSVRTANEAGGDVPLRGLTSISALEARKQPCALLPAGGSIARHILRGRREGMGGKEAGNSPRCAARSSAACSSRLGLGLIGVGCRPRSAPMEAARFA